MKILFLTQWFDPEPNFKGIPFAKELVRMGHEVEILTGFPNYPGGKIYKGYRIKFFQREYLENIPIIRVPLYPSHNSNSVKRVLNYLSFALSSSIIGPFLIKKPDLIYVYHPPATVGFPAIFMHLLRQVPFVYDIQDLWPETLAATGMVNNRFIMSFVEKWCRVIYSQAAKIVVLSPGFKKVLIERGVSANDIEVIYNWCEENKIRKTDRNEKLACELEMADRFNVLFAGTMGKAQALDAVLEAARLIRNTLPIVQFVFVGGGIDVGRLKRKASELNLDNVIFLDRRPSEEIAPILNLSDVLLVHLRHDPLFKITIPSKTQAYMAVGRPILMAVRGDAAVLVEMAGAGLACVPEDPQDIADKVERFYKMPTEDRERMGQCGENYYREKLSLEKGALRFEKIFRSILA